MGGIMKVYVDEKNESLARHDDLCIDCGICVQTCEKNNGFKNDCINCGQCILSCPTGALVVKSQLEQLKTYLKNPEYTVIVSTSPSVRVSIGDEFGYEPGSFLEGKVVRVLKDLGFDYVFDTTFGADLTVMEEATELVKRLTKKEHLPQLTSCCPSWVLYMEKYHPEDLDLISSCKSPISMQGAVIKNYFATLNSINPEKIINVALTPCVSKKSEIKRPGLEGMDFVVTVSELAGWIRDENIEFSTLEDASYDEFLGKGSGGGVIFGASGGVMESALRCAYYLLHKTDAPANFYQLTDIRGSIPMKEATVDLGGIKVNVLVINEISNAEKMYRNFKNYDFVEVMTCPGGCIGGAGLSKLARNAMEQAREKRIQNLYQNDKDLQIRNAYQNPDIEKIYSDFLQSPGSEVSEQFLHTSYSAKEKQTNQN